MDRLADEGAVRSLIERWAVWRDAGDWQRFATVWHPDGRMIATYFDGPASEFVERSRAGWEKGVNITHFLGGTAVDFEGERALAQTRMTITLRTVVGGVLADVTCSGRFYDFIERRDARWGFVQRQCIYENDRLSLVDPGRTIELDPEALARFPEGYRHLGYVQDAAGMTVTLGLPGRIGPEVEALYERGRAWLRGTSGG